VQHEEEEEWEGEHDADFDVFFQVDSDTQQFPKLETRSFWNEKALKHKDAELAEYETASRSKVFAACHRIIEKFTKSD
jgi:hypothetical protein